MVRGPWSRLKSALIIFILLLTPALRAQILSGWDHAIIRQRQDSLLVLGSVSATGDMDAAFTLNRRVAKRWMFTASSLVTSRDPSYVGAVRGRPDLPFHFSTGRFLSGEIRYQGEILRFRLGRLFPDYHPFSQNTPYARETLSGDGVDWSVGRSFWRFENRIVFLKNELADDRAVNRLFNFHALNLAFGKWSLSLGEFLIYTGINRGVDWLWSNPFVPYVLHNYDAYSDKDAGIAEYGGDSDNVMLYFRIGYTGNRFSLNTRLYLDEFQVDAPDREGNVDEYLSHTQMTFFIGGQNRVSALIPESVTLTAAFASSGFGYHRGPFTSFTTGDYFLLPSESGRIRHACFTGFWKGERWHLIFDAWAGQYADILSLEPDQRSRKEFVKTLSSETRTGFRVRAAAQPWKNTAVAIDSRVSKENSLHTVSVVQYLNF